MLRPLAGYVRAAEQTAWSSYPVPSQPRVRHSVGPPRRGPQDTPGTTEPRAARAARAVRGVVGLARVVDGAARVALARVVDLRLGLRRGPVALRRGPVLLRRRSRAAAAQPVDGAAAAARSSLNAASTARARRSASA